MVGQWTVMKPSRSDEILDANEQLKLANQVRAQFDSLAPKRPSKPGRSESDSAPVEYIPSLDHAIPELEKLRSLRSQSQVLFAIEGDDSVKDEFVETQYYKELESIDKQHHTTGTGFIRAVGLDDQNRFGIQFPGVNARVVVIVGGSNPATNDWIPRDEEDLGFVTSKPNRSEGC